MKKILLLVLSIFTINSCFANEAYISGPNSFYYHSGPSTKYKIIGSVDSQDTVEIIDTTNSHQFYKIKTKHGDTGWLSREYVSQGISEQAKTKLLRQDLTASLNLIKRQADEIHRLKMLVSTQKMARYIGETEQSKLNSQINNLTSEIDSLDDSNLIRWITHLSTIALLASIVLYMLGFFRNRKKNRQFY
ncbi:SH3 domain-containing protein [Gammaproteobacteria bacterium AS21]